MKSWTGYRLEGLAVKVQKCFELKRLEIRYWSNQELEKSQLEIENILS